jgi:hypothetical protein
LEQEMKAKPKKKVRKARRINRSPKLQREETVERQSAPSPAESFHTALPTSSLSEESGEEAALRRRNLPGAGDLTGLAGAGVSSPETVAELLEEGQDREGELLDAIENARDADRGEVPVHRQRRQRPPSYKDRNKL